MRNAENIFKSIMLTEFFDEDADNFIDINPEEFPEKVDNSFPDELAILPLRNTVLFPGVVMPITVHRANSVKLVQKAYKDNDLIGVVTQHNLNTREPGEQDLYKVGTVARILKRLKMPDGNLTIIIQGRTRFRIDEMVQETPYPIAKVTYLEEKKLNKSGRAVEAIAESLRDAAFKVLSLNPEIPPEAQMALENIESTNFLINFLAANVSASLDEKQELLEKDDMRDRATALLKLMSKEIQILEIKNEINNRTHSDIDQQQRDYFLRQQIKTLQEELGDDGPERDLSRLRQAAKSKKWKKDTKAYFYKELERFERMNPAAPDYGITLSYLEFMVDLPWLKYTDDKLDLAKAKEVLDKDHYGLKKVKDRVLEYLAVLKLRKTLRGPILCLYGPPGVGKTSLGKSVAKALGREYCRMSLGGLRDEAELRGHRRTYIGAMPGRILQNLKKAGTSNPVFVLDEIDKIGSDFRGDPASALLEILDPEQNNAFTDNYLEAEYDLSKVIFIATANSLDTLHPALRDRMEIIEVNGYTVEEKVQIAKKHLVPKLRKDHGVNAKQVSFLQPILTKVIEDYTRESGVRNLEQKLAAVIRNIAKSVAMEEDYNSKIKEADIERILGVPIYDKELYEEDELIGIVPGLAWTQVGGEMLYVEASLSKGKGSLTLSGRLGDVMKESAKAAHSYLRAHAQEWHIEHELFEQNDLHIHFPAGAVPKDGPSAGITILTAIASAYTNRKVKPNIAMTGEVTLRGKVLPVGGIQEKILAARRAGISQIILCKRNRKDIEEIEAQYRKDMTFHYVNRAEEVLNLALC
ncbi:MAG: endopeptidase La [Bernardetiaceae bacterium]|nr:endopeptidase La [Bernardetiaceae bacterium]